MAVVGRLKPGVTIAQAQAEATILVPRLKGGENPDSSTDIKTVVTSLKDQISGKLRHSLIMLWCAVALILLIVCVNLSNLLLARAAARSREFAMRRALGARRGRLMRQLLTDVIVKTLRLTLVGIGLGAIASFAVARGIGALLYRTEPNDPATFALTILVLAAVALAAGYIPARRASSIDPMRALRAN